MFNQTKTRIIAWMMLILTVLFLGTLGVIFVSSCLDGAKSNTEKMNRYAHLYTLSSQTSSISDSDSQSSSPPSANSNSDTPKRPPNQKTVSFQLTTFYSVALDSDGSALAVDTDDSEIYDDEALTALATEIFEKGKSRGARDNLIYSSYDKGGYTLVVFMDNTLLSESFSTLFRYTLIFGGIALILIYFISAYIARSIVKPLEKSYQMQKQFVSDAGHELKTPVSVISANLELLERETGSNQWLENVRYENEHMGKLVEQLLELTRTENETVVFESVDLSHLVSGEVLTLESVAFEHGFTFVTDIDDSLFVNGNTTQLKQLITILIDNAMQHSAGDEIDINLNEQRGHARLTVVNDGEEIPAEQREALFDRFYRVDDARNGEGSEKHYGLGLAIAKAIVTRHKGKISVDCRRGQVEFAVVIPLQK